MNNERRWRPERDRRSRPGKVYLPAAACSQAQSARALRGGMAALMDDSAAIYVTDDSPNAEARYRARLFIVI